MQSLDPALDQDLVDPLVLNDRILANQGDRIEVRDFEFVARLEVRLQKITALIGRQKGPVCQLDGVPDRLLAGADGEVDLPTGNLPLRVDPVKRRGELKGKILQQLFPGQPRLKMHPDGVDFAQDVELEDDILKQGVPVFIRRGDQPVFDIPDPLVPEMDAHKFRFPGLLDDPGFMEIEFFNKEVPLQQGPEEEKPQDDEQQADKGLTVSAHDAALPDKPDGGVDRHGDHPAGDAAGDSFLGISRPPAHDNGAEIVEQGLADDLAAGVYPHESLQPADSGGRNAAFDEELLRAVEMAVRPAQMFPAPFRTPPRSPAAGQRWRWSEKG